MRTSRTVSRAHRCGWRSRSAAVGTLVLSGIAVLAGSSQTIEITGGLPDGGDCASLGSWDPVNSLCEIDDLVLDAGARLTVNNATLDVCGLVSRQAAVDNMGTMFIQGRLLNTGIIVNHPGASLSIDGGNGCPDAPQENSGTIDNDGFLMLFHRLDNLPEGLLETSGSVLNSSALVPFRNSGTVIVDAVWSNDADFQNRASGTFVVNPGATVYSELSVVVSNDGRWDNHGTVGGNLWTLENAGVFNNHGILSTCDDFGLNGAINNFGWINNFGNIAVCGVVQNIDSINNAGQIADSSSNLGGSVSNSGTILNCGSLTAPVTGDPATPDTDGDGDGYCDQQDCAQVDGAVWAAAGDARFLRLSPDDPVPEVTRLDWVVPQYPGAVSTFYDLVSSAGPADFDLLATCIESGDGGDSTAIDPVAVFAGEVRFYLVRAENFCGGSAGTRSDGTSRIVRECP